MILSYCGFKTAFLLASDIFKTEDVTSKTALLITTLLDFWRVW